MRPHDDAAQHQADADPCAAPGTAEPRPASTPAAKSAASCAAPAPSGEHPLERFAPAAALLAVAALVLTGLSAFGIWDPWEIDLAERARRMVEGEAATTPQIGPWLVSQGFRLFGVDEWSGRLPIAISAVAAAALAYPLVARFAGRRAGAYAVLIAGTSPLFLFNARTMLGEAPVFALQTAIALCASLALFGPRARSGTSAAQPAASGASGASVGFLALALLLAAVATLGRGALLGALPPLAAAALLAAFEGKLHPRNADPLGFAVGVALWLSALGLALAVTQAVLADRAGFDIWLGGAPQGGQPPTFEVVIERVFHAFAPWSALLPLALARVVMPRDGAVEATAQDDDERRLRVLCLLWLGLSYAALTLFLSRYGDKAAPFPVIALAAVVALFLRDIERERASQWPAAIAAGLLAALIARDYALYPSGPVHGMPLADFAVPEVFNPKRTWGAMIGVFGAAAVLGLGAYSSGEDGPLRQRLAAPYRLIAAQWRRGASFKIWLLVLAAALLGLIVFSAVAWSAPKAAGLSTQAAKWGKRLTVVPAVLPLAVAGLQLLVHLFSKLRELRSLPILLAGTAVGVYAAFGFMPALSAHFSPREVYETYNELAVEGEALVEYKVGARAARYYAKGEALEVDNMSRLMDELLAPRRAWAVFPAEDLAPIDRMFRTKTGRHLFVADARSAKVTLATNKPIAGRADQSFLTQFVKREPPAAIQHRVSASFDDKIELLGYDLKLPHGDHVAAGESFEIIWYFRALQAVPGTYKVFVHIDANAMRIHGDHEPVDGRYPVRLWDAGDVIIDRQRLEVPPNYSAGSYTIYLGFFSGETRLVVKRGPKDDANRVKAGVLRIR